MFGDAWRQAEDTSDEFKMTAAAKQLRDDMGPRSVQWPALILQSSTTSATLSSEVTLESL